ncbi:hypothetical protein [uncultured Sphingomonas sp.]|uniref:hypothetical protein n=1 Tax=uncultured Sphingomonas sp. TaxID=158754 RepID=UPI003749723F
MDKPPPFKQQPFWDILTKIAAPGAIAVGAVCYLSGYAFNEALMREFGQSSGAVSTSVQETTATGSIVIILLLFVFAFLLWLCVLLQAIYYYIPMKYRPLFGGELSSSFRRLIARSFSFRTQVFVILLGCGLIGGFTAGDFRARSIKRSILTGCQSRCFEYRTSRGTLTGRMIAQDQNRALIAGRGRVYLIDAKDLRSAAPVRFGKIAADWS